MKFINYLRFRRFFMWAYIPILLSGAMKLAFEGNVYIKTFGLPFVFLTLEVMIFSFIKGSFTNARKGGPVAFYGHFVLLIVPIVMAIIDYKNDNTIKGDTQLAFSIITFLMFILSYLAARQTYYNEYRNN